jgi:RNA polymerase sigma factor (sigma-70 family)
VTQRNDEDLALCRRAASGDRAAFALLVGKYERPLRSFLQRMGVGDADDVAQEAFLKAWRSAAQYDGRARFSTWLTSIAWRCRLDQLRRHRWVASDAPDAQSSPQAAAEIDDMLARLSESERASLILCEGHGWTHEEAAQLLGMPHGTLKSTVARGKLKCRALWNGEGHG